MTYRSISVDSFEIQGVKVPRLIFGTAWKGDETEMLTVNAVRLGFRGFDTANQKKHYDETAVGTALRKSIEGGLVHPEEIFIQSKFTFAHGQDERLPYSPDASYSTQVRQSIENSLENFQRDQLESYILHSPFRKARISEEDLIVWSEMENAQRLGKIRLIGVSNIEMDQLARLVECASCAPAFVQNRCSANYYWDQEMRDFCTSMDIAYQGFSIYPANIEVFHSDEILNIARNHRKTPAQIAYRFALQLGIISLTGTSNRKHLEENLRIFDFELDENEFLKILFHKSVANTDGKI